MISIILLHVFLIAYFFAIGWQQRFGFLKFISWASGLLQLLITVWIVYINEVGGSIVSLLYYNALGVLIVGGFLGVLTILILMFKMGNVSNDKPMEEDSYTKWMHE